MYTIGESIANSFINSASLSIFEVPLNSIDAYRQMRGLTTVGKFGMGTIFILVDTLYSKSDTIMPNVCINQGKIVLSLKNFSNTDIIYNVILTESIPYMEKSRIKGQLFKIFSIIERLRWDIVLGDSLYTIIDTPIKNGNYIVDIHGEIYKRQSKKNKYQRLSCALSQKVSNNLSILEINYIF